MCKMIYLFYKDFNLFFNFFLGHLWSLIAYMVSTFRRSSISVSLVQVQVVKYLRNLFLFLNPTLILKHCMLNLTIFDNYRIEK